MLGLIKCLPLGLCCSISDTNLNAVELGLSCRYTYTEAYFPPPRGRTAYTLPYVPSSWWPEHQETLGRYHPLLKPKELHRGRSCFPSGLTPWAITSKQNSRERYPISYSSLVLDNPNHHHHLGLKKILVLFCFPCFITFLVSSRKPLRLLDQTESSDD